MAVVRDRSHAGPATSEPARAVRHAAEGRWAHRWARFGMIVRGVLFFVCGLLALELAFGHTRGTMTPKGAIQAIGHEPDGRILLVAVAAGLAGYAGWGLVRAILDPLGRGHKPMGIVQRIGYLVSALAYTALFVTTVRSFTGLWAGAHDRDWTVALLSHRFGALVLLGIGLCWILGAGALQIVQGWTHKFERDLDVARMGPTERRWARALGTVGMVARGIVFAIIGVLIVAVATHARPERNVGMDGALLQILHRPYGRPLLGAAGAGLIAFGCFSAMSARWLRMRDRDSAPDAAAIQRGTP